MESLEQPVTRREFVDELSKISTKIDELVKAKQVSWPLIIGILTLALGILGAGVKNWADVLALNAQSQGNTAAVSDFRERIRGLEANTHAILVENETQNRWMADIFNAELQHLETLVRIKHPEIPPRSYWPLGQIGQAHLNGKK